VSLPEHYLVPHIYVCSTGNGVVLLDLRRDRYLGLTPLQSMSLQGIVPGWPTNNCDADVTPDEAKKSVEELVTAGILTADPACGKSAKPAAERNSSVSLTAIESEIEHSPPIHARDVINFMRACLSARISLKVQSFERVVDRVRRRRARNQRLPFPPQRAAELADTFRRLRTLTFTAHRRCLFHALALVNFLSYYDIFPDWVLGVRLAPFTAHSWVQEGQFILDATPEDVCFYTPILAV